ncbi:MAG: hypothetical protein VW378_07605 [bacterium]
MDSRKNGIALLECLISISLITQLCISSSWALSQLYQQLKLAKTYWEAATTIKYPLPATQTISLPENIALDITHIDNRMYKYTIK